MTETDILQADARGATYEWIGAGAIAVAAGVAVGLAADPLAVSVFGGGNYNVEGSHLTFQLQPRLSTPAGRVKRFGIFDHQAFVAAGLGGVEERIEFGWRRCLEHGSPNQVRRVSFVVGRWEIRGPSHVGRRRQGALGHWSSALSYRSSRGFGLKTEIQLRLRFSRTYFSSLCLRVSVVRQFLFRKKLFQNPCSFPQRTINY